MKINLNAGGEVRSEPVSLGAAGEFHVTVRNPSYEELIADSSKFTGYIEDRLKTCLVGWAGLTEEVAAEVGDVNQEPTERDIPFTWENFKKVCAQYPAAFRRIVGIVNACYSGGEAQKNSGSGSAGFSADSVLQQLIQRNGLPSAGLGTSPGQLVSPPKPS